MNKKAKEVLIIGGGAAGMAAAARLTQNNNNCNIVVLERGKKLGRKIAVSGNGRCNITNINVSPKFYNNPEFLEEHLKKYSFEKIKEFYLQLGLLLSGPDDEGRVYPLANTSASVIQIYDIFFRKNKNINLIKDIEVVELSKRGSRYAVIAGGKEFEADKVIVAHGSPAYTGFENSYLDKYLSRERERCGLCPLIADKKELKYLENLRLRAKVKGMGREETGEVQFRKDSISGIVAFNFASNLARSGNTEGQLIISPLAGIAESELRDRLFLRRNECEKAAEIFAGIIPEALSWHCFLRAGIDENLKPSDLTDKHIAVLAHVAKNLEFNVSLNTDFSQAQVSVGGVRVDQVDNITYESKVHGGLYVVGEALNIDGECGGFNLHFAASSAIAAAEDIAKKC